MTAHVHPCQLKIEGELRSPSDSGFFSRKAWHTVHSLLGVTKICSKNYRGHGEIMAEPALLRPANVPLSAALDHSYAQYHTAVTSGKAWGMVCGKWRFAPLNVFIAIFASIYNHSPCSSRLISLSTAENSHQLRQSLWTYKLSLNAYVRGGCCLCSRSYSQGQPPCLHHWAVAAATDRTSETERDRERERESAEGDAEILESDVKQTQNRMGFSAVFC